MTCPSAEQWRAFLDEKLSEDEQVTLNEHLESCDDCPKLLESLAAGTETWRGTADQLAASDKADDPADSDRLRDVMDQLRNADLDAPRTVSPESLTFLSPSENEEAIGRLAHYEVLEIIGAGGMGVVLKAWDPSLRRVVAIKVLAAHLANSASARRRFVREAHAVAAVSHDHVVAIHAVDAENEPPFLVMYYVEGRTLQSRIDQDGPLQLREFLRIGEQTARGLAAAHEQGIIHRDIKPSNILLENGVERVRITDFGLARAVDDASMTQSGVLAGTPLFMAPEQAQGEPLDHRADLFSLGSLLYAMCTGRSPFRSSTIMGVIRRVCDDEPRPIREINPDVPDWFCAIVDRLLSKKREERFQTAEEVASLLADCLAHVQQPLTIQLPELAGTFEKQRVGRENVVEQTLAEAEISGSQDPIQTTSTVEEPAKNEATDPPANEPLDDAASSAAREKLLHSGCLLRRAGILNAVVFLTFVVYVATVSRGELDDIAPFAAFCLLLSGMIYYGGRRLENGDSEGWPTLAAILCWLSPPCWPLGIPAAFSTRKTFSDANVRQILASRIQRVRGPGQIMTTSEFVTVLTTGILATLCSIRAIISLFAFAVPAILIWIDLSTYHFQPMIESLVTPAGVAGLVALSIVFLSCFGWRRSGLHDFGGTVTSFSLLTLLGIVLTSWGDEVDRMGYVHARISTPGAVISLHRPNGGIELMFGKENLQMVRIPAGPWEWSVHLGADEPLMTEQLKLVRSGVTILEPKIPRGRDVIPGEYSVVRMDRRANQNASPTWLRQPERVVIVDGKLAFQFADGTSKAWLAEFDTTNTVPAASVALAIDLRDPDTNVVAAIGTYSVSEGGLQLRLSPSNEQRPTRNWVSPSGQQALATFHLKRTPTLVSLQGVWKPVLEKTAGREVRGAGHIAQNLADERIYRGYQRQPSTDALNYVWEFSGENLTSRVAEKEFMSGKVLLTASTEPPRLTWMFNGPSQKLEYTEQKMIYRLRRDGDGEILEVAFQLTPKDFPSQMESTRGNAQAWILFRRQE
jgi:uncharacterized protein (TIGR03067 family)